VQRIPPRRRILGETIRKCRKHAKVTQEQLAEKANLHPVYLGKIERGEKWISVHALLRIADALEIRLSDLVVDL
jgi:transcriptional regulator with XRE-family HTH domain